MSYAQQALTTQAHAQQLPGAARNSAADSIARLRALLADPALRVPNASLQLIKGVGECSGRIWAQVPSGACKFQLLNALISACTRNGTHKKG